MMMRPRRAIVRADAGLSGLERVLQRHGFYHVAGVDEAGRGACAGPLVAAAVILPPGGAGEIAGLTDSKLLTQAARERIYVDIRRLALAYCVVAAPAAQVDALGVQVANVQALRRAVAGLSVPVDYVLCDGFAVDGLGCSSLAVWKGDQVSACVAAASVLAKVERDRIMTELDARYPRYEFARHKGYVTAMHTAALAKHGPCVEHRLRYANVAASLGNATSFRNSSDERESVLAGGA